MEALELLPIASMTLLGAVTALRSRLHGQRWQRQRRHEGVQWCQSLQQLVMHLQRHRGLSSVYLNGDKSAAVRLAREREDANRLIHTLAQLPDSHLSAADVLPKAQWQQFCHDWQQLCATLDTLGAADSIHQHTELITLALNWLRAIGEASLSRSSADHAWVSVLVDQLPALSEALGQARAISAGIAVRGHCSAVARVRLAYLMTRIEGLAHTCRRALSADRHGHHPAMREGLSRIDAATQHMLTCLRCQMSGNPSANGSDCFAVATEAIDAVFALMAGLLAGALPASQSNLPLAA
jgi:hypothetical protein